VQLVIALTTIAGVIAAFIFGYTNLREQQATLSQGYENLKQQQQAAAQQDQESRYSSISQIELDVDTGIADHPRLISCFADVTCNAKPDFAPLGALRYSLIRPPRTCLRWIRQ
jgi:Flp pilus assembly protein TadB